MGDLVLETPSGAVGFVDHGDGSPVLFVHGSPGGSDQGALMGRFLVDAGFRVVAPSRPGYPGTPLTEANGGAEGTAELLRGLMDGLGVDSFAVMCWSGGGPSAYQLAAAHPERVRSLVACAAVSGPYTFATGVARIERSLMSSGLGHHVLRALAEHAPKSLVASTVKEEGHLTDAEVEELTEHIWDHEETRDFVLDLSATLSGRRAGLKNDEHRFPGLDVPLGSVVSPTLLVHGTADSDVGPEHSERALAGIAGSEILRVERGTHLSVWTDPTAEVIQARIVEHLGGYRRG
ncbi:MAG: alpha/beta fold hydrolase [Acidimicrobiales bacterium]|jgi:pimeloyl-ACP methyl ester carboxylesterase